MNKPLSQSGVQLHLNLHQFETLIADHLTTEEVREFARTVAKKNFSSREIREQAKNGQFNILYRFGTLRITPSDRRGEGRLWRWDITFRPNSL